MTKKLLGDDCAWPPTYQRQKVKLIFRSAPPTAARRRLISLIGLEANQTCYTVQDRYPARDPPQYGHHPNRDCKNQNCKKAGTVDQVWFFREFFVGEVSRKHPPRALLAVCASLNLECDILPNLRSGCLPFKRFDVRKNVLSAVGWLDKTKAPVVIPLAQRPLEFHVRSL